MMPRSRSPLLRWWPLCGSLLAAPLAAQHPAASLASTVDAPLPFPRADRLVAPAVPDAPPPTASRHVTRGDSVAQGAPIRDNSFLVEEAYNQDPRTVQHINTFSRDAGDWAYALTGEWAVRGQRHQLGATLSLARVTVDSTSASGLGDVAVNYRYQVAGVDGGRVAAAPRVSLVVPTGNASRGLGAGALGIQLMLPVSVTLGSALVAHANAGVSHAGADRSSASGARSTTTYTLGQSVIWLARARMNLLLESVWSTTDAVAPTGVHTRVRALTLSPGVRWAYDLPHELQVVPGVAVPLGIGPSRGDRAVLLYLSFENPY
jgi:hypothetical protein